MHTVTVKWPSLTLAHPNAKPGWTNKAQRIGIMHITNVPDDVQAGDLLTRLHATILQMSDRNVDPEEWQVSYASLGVGKIAGPRRRPDLRDDVQETCIARMQQLQLTPYDVAERVAGRLESAHVAEFLTRRRGMSTFKVQHVFEALELDLVPRRRPHPEAD